MFMSKKMVIAVFIIAVAFWTESEFQLGIRFIGSSADSTLMSGNSLLWRSFYFWAKFLSHSLLSSGDTNSFSSAKEEYEKIEQWCNDRYRNEKSAAYTLHYHYHNINNTKDFYLDRDDEH